MARVVMYAIGWLFLKKRNIEFQKVVDPTYLCYVREADNPDIPSRNLSTSSIVLYK
jgi:hypothetical protein